jgi:hypothetical protein
MVKQYNYATNLMVKPYLTRGVAKKKPDFVDKQAIC